MKMLRQVTGMLLMTLIVMVSGGQAQVVDKKTLKTPSRLGVPQW